MKRIALALTTLAAAVALVTFTAAPAEAEPTPQPMTREECLRSYGNEWCYLVTIPPSTPTLTAEPTVTPTQEPTVEPTPEPSPTSTTPAPSPTTPAPEPSTPQPTSTSTPTPTSTSTPTTRCVWSGGEFIGQGDPRDCPRPALPGATASTGTVAPVVGPLVETDIPFEHRNIPRSW